MSLLTLIHQLVTRTESLHDRREATYGGTDSASDVLLMDDEPGGWLLVDAQTAIDMEDAR